MNEEKKKNNTGLIIVIVILIVLVLALCGYIAYDKLVVEKKGAKEVKTKEVVESKIEALDLSNSEISDSMNKLSRMTCGEGLYYYFLEKDKVEAKDISNEDAILFITPYYYDYSAKNEGNTDVVKKNENGIDYLDVSEEDLTKKVQQYFGKDYKFEHKTYDNGPATFEYDKDKKQYKVIINGFGCTGPINTSIGAITRAYHDNNKLVVTYRVLFGEDILDNPKDIYYSKYYKDFNKKEEISKDNLVFINYPYYQNLLVADSDYLKNFSYGSEYEFTFEKQDNEYVFASSKLKK